MKRVFSGIQPSGILHLGNYLGAIKQWADLQKDHECIYCIVDLHAITVPQDPKELSANIYRAAAAYLACGVNPQKSTIFIQSHRPEHAELAWIINTFTKFGEMRRMTQFKDKAGKFEDQEIPLGLFTYPVLMAADILLYQTNLVPVGDDQKQHVEITRDLAQRFNNKYGSAFTLPMPHINKQTARIMGLDDPTQKMSKSAGSSYNYIALTDEAVSIRQKIAKSVTDSGNEIRVSAAKPAITNLLNIFSQLSGTPIDKLEKKYQNSSYSAFKSDLAGEVASKIVPIGKKIRELEKDTETLKRFLDKGAERLEPLAQATLKRVRGNIGLV